MSRYLITCILLCTCLLSKRAHGFRDAFLNFSHSTIRVPVDINISFAMTWDMELDEELRVGLPRFTDGSPVDSSPSAVDYSLKISPSIDFEAAWVEGSYNNNDDPFSDSYVLLRIRDPLRLPKADTYINVTVLASNGIYAYCGFASSFTFVKSTTTEKFQISSTASSRPANTVLGTYRNVSSKSVTTPFVHEQFGRGCSGFHNCNGQGSCDFCRERCECYDGFGSATDFVATGAPISGSCTERVCPYGIAISDLASTENTAHERAECSNAGVCDRVTGECKCRAPWSGSACDRRECPNKCSGHGQCVSMADMTLMYHALPLQKGDLLRTTNIAYGVSRETTAWDAEIMQGCVCESRWSVGFGDGETQLPEYFGADCSLRRCPSGDDPFTREEETNCRGKLQEGSLLTSGSGLNGNLCHIDCSGRGICDYTTGQCKCFPGSHGDNCGSFGSPNRALLE